MNENDALGFLSKQTQEGEAEPKKGLIDYCFEAKKVVPLTPSPPPKSEVIEDTYRIFDMDVLKVRRE